MKDSEKNLPKSAGQWRDWVTACFDGNNNGLRPPQALLSVANQSNAPLAVMVAGIATRQNDKSVESCGHVIRICANEDSIIGGLERLNKTVTRVLDPGVTLSGKRLSAFRARHPLRTVRHSDRPLPDSLRCALANHLPALEVAMFNFVQPASGIVARTPSDFATATNWGSNIKIIVTSTTPGSPLRRREAIRRAASELEMTLRKLATEGDAESPGNNASPASSDASTKPKRGKKKKETAT
jgi:hypothetical protein